MGVVLGGAWPEAMTDALGGGARRTLPFLPWHGLAESLSNGGEQQAVEF